MDIWAYLVLYFTAFIGGIVQGISGFAFGIVILCVLPYFFTYVESLVILSFVSLFMLAVNSFVYRKHVVWKQLPASLTAFVVGTFFSVKLLKYTAGNPIWTKLLGAIFIVLAFYLLFCQGKIKIQPTVKNAVIFNGIAGIISGLFGVGGPIAVLYFLAALNTKEEYMSTIQFYCLFGVVFDFVIRVFNGMVNFSIIQFGLSCVGFVFLGLYVGKKLFERIDGLMLQKVICCLMIFNGISLLVR